MPQIRFGETCVSMGDLQDPIDGGTDSIYKAIRPINLRPM